MDLTVCFDILRRRCSIERIPGIWQRRDVLRPGLVLLGCFGDFHDSVVAFRLRI